MNDYFGSLKQLSNSEMHNINRILKDNCLSHKYDLIMIDYIKFIHVFIIKDVDAIEKASPLVCLCRRDRENPVKLYDAGGNDIDISNSFKNFVNERFPDDCNNDCNFCEEYLYYWLKNSGYSSSRIYYIKQDVKDSGSEIILEMMRSIKELQ